MKKYKYFGLILELTRKCNLHCAHCMRGDAQDITMSREVIDKIVDNVDDCLRFSFTGGEPLLAIDELEYIVDRIIEKDWTTEQIDFVTNGTIQDKRVVDIFTRFCKSRTGRKADLLISHDKFHDMKKSEETLTYYQEAAKDIPGIEIKFNLDIGGKFNEDKEATAFILSGRGKTINPGCSGMGKVSFDGQ